MKKLLILTLVVFLFGCKKTDDVNYNFKIHTEREGAISESVFPVIVGEPLKLKIYVDEFLGTSDEYVQFKLKFSVVVGNAKVFVNDGEVKQDVYINYDFRSYNTGKYNVYFADYIQSSEGECHLEVTISNGKIEKTVTLKQNGAI